MKTKYIVYRVGGSEFMICFPEILVHRVVAAKLDTAIDNLDLGAVSIVSAGFVFTSTGRCYGNSESLGVESRPEIDGKLFAGNLSGSAALPGGAR